MKKESAELERRWYGAYGLNGSPKNDPDLQDDFYALLENDPFEYLRICESLLARDDYKRFSNWIAINLFEDFTFRQPSLVNRLYALCKTNSRAYEALEDMYYDKVNNERFSQGFSDLIDQAKVDAADGEFERGVVPNF